MASIMIKINEQNVDVEIEPEDIFTLSVNEDKDFANYFLRQMKECPQKYKEFLEENNLKEHIKKDNLLDEEKIEKAIPSQIHGRRIRKIIAQLSPKN